MLPPDLAARLVRLERLVAVEREIARRRAEDPLSLVDWLPGQHAFLSCPDKVKLFRAGFQAHGKTWAGAAELIYRMRGDHPFRPDIRPAPIRAWVVCGSEKQSQIVQEKVWELVPKQLLAPRCIFDTRKGGFVGRTPRLIFKNGSIAEFRSGGAKGVNTTSGTLDFIWIDEPPDSEHVYEDLLKRLMRRNGDLAMTFTPWNNPVEHIKDKVDAGQIEDLHFLLTPENLIPVGRTEPLRLADGTPMDADWVAEQRAKTSPMHAPVMIDGEWEFRAVGAYFEGAWNTNLVCEATIDPGDSLVVGIDHGDRPGKQVMVLMAVGSGEAPHVHVIDIYRDLIGTASPADDARGLVDMLKRHGIEWGRLRFVGGDRVHLPGSGRQKSNQDLAVQIRRVLGVRDLKPGIRTVKRGAGRGAGSLTVGSRWLYHAMVAERFTVDPRCEHLITALPKYDLRDDDDGYKDVIDAIRYGLDSWIFRWAGQTRAPVIRLG